MIIGATRVKKDARSKGYLVNHLLDKVEQNEVIEVVYGSRETFDLMKSFAKPQLGKYAFRHMHINPQHEEHAGIENINYLVDEINKEFHVEETRARVLVKHVKPNASGELRTHYHYVIAEYDHESEHPLLDDSYNYLRHEKLSREFNKKFGEKIHPLRKERKAKAIPHVSPDQRQRAERVEPNFNAGKLAIAYAEGISALKAEMKSQGIKAENGYKKIILVNNNNEIVSAFDRALKMDGKTFKLFYEEFVKENTDVQPNLGEINVQEKIVITTKTDKTENLTNTTAVETTSYSNGNQGEGDSSQERHAESGEIKHQNKQNGQSNLGRSSINGSTIEGAIIVDFKGRIAQRKAQQRYDNGHVGNNIHAIKFPNNVNGNNDKESGGSFQGIAKVKEELKSNNLSRFLKYVGNKLFGMILERKEYRSRIMSMRSVANDNLEKINQLRYRALNIIPDYHNPPKQQKPKLSVIVNNDKDSQSGDYTPPNMKF